MGFISALLDRRRVEAGHKPGLEHVGDEHAGKMRIDGDGERQRLAHRVSLECLAATSNSRGLISQISLIDLAHPVITRHALDDVGVIGLWHVIPFADDDRRGSRRGSTWGHGLGHPRALAAGFAAALVALFDEGAPQQRLQGRHLPQQFGALFAEAGGDGISAIGRPRN